MPVLTNTLVINFSLGYIHTAFAFGYESHINKTTIDSSLIPPGALISFLQRGISYVQIESKLNISSVSNLDGLYYLLS